MGQAPSGESYNKAGEGLPLIAGAGDFGILYPKPKKFTTQFARTSREGDIIVGIRASIGMKIWSDGNYCLGRGVAGLRAQPALADQHYVWHWLTKVEGELAAKGKGATFKQVTKEDLCELKIPLPPIEEQRRIAAILDKAAEIRTKRRAALTQLDNLTGFIFTQARGSAPRVELGTHLDFITSGARGWASYYADSGTRFIRSLDVRMGEISSASCVFVNAPDSAEARRIATRPGDVLLTITGSRIGRASVVPDDLAGSYISQHVAILRPKTDRLSPAWLCGQLVSPDGQAQVAASQYGQSKPGLGFDHIRRFQLPLPELADQEKYAVLVESSLSLRRSMGLDRQKVDALFSSLQERAFRGEL
jgi:type I restriction enzyme, S subunit